MADSESRLRAEIAGSLAGDGPAPGPHPDADRLMAYHAGELPGADAEQVQEHLSLCRPCMEDLLDLESFVAAGERGPAPVKDLGAASLLRSLQRETGRRAPSWLPLAAAALLMATLGLGIWGTHQRLLLNELRERSGAIASPRPDARIADLYGQSFPRGGSGEAAAVSLPPKDGFLLLILNLPQAPERATFEVEIEGPGGKKLWEGQLRQTEFGTLQLGLPGNFLEAGRHRILVHAETGGERRLIETFPVTFAQAPNQG